MKTYYRIRNLIKYVEEDDWENGCDPDTAREWEVIGEWTGATPEDVIAKVAAFVGCAVGGPDDGVERNACDEPGRVDFATTENAEGYPLTKSEVELWKQGKLRAWYCIYTGYMMQISEAQVTL